MDKLKTVVITGAHGFIGRNLVDCFAKKNYRVIGIGHGSLPEYVSKKLGFFRWYEADINIESLEAIEEKTDILIHCAGVSTVGKAAADPIGSFKKNILVTQEILEFVRHYKTSVSMLYISSAGVYGDTGEYSASEDAKLQPLSEYGLQKKIGEDICQYYSEKYNFSIDIIRPFSVYGEGLNKQLLWDACTKFQEDIITFWGSGNEVRDWIHVSDLVDLIYKCTTHEHGGCRVFNACTGSGISNKALLQILANIFYEDKIHIIKFNGKRSLNDPIHLVGDNGRSIKMLDWKIDRKREEALASYIRWYRTCRKAVSVQ